MRHRRPRFSKKAKTLLSGAVALAAAVGVTVARADEPGKECTAFDTVTLGEYYVNNSLWNEGKHTGTQCVWSNSRSGATISWGTSQSLANSATGKDHDVKSYASTVLGWHWGWETERRLRPVAARQEHRRLAGPAHRRGHDLAQPAGRRRTPGHEGLLRQHRLNGRAPGVVGAPGIGYIRSSSTGR
ncbi:hypothetical protein [Streptomyces sp. Act143]|uniref:hypothetical protein n=1 Tax=Streptomyces sp. Act143 TaxID=2200760 RepID=UPI0011B788FF|nr:hypothetical protein [Streptomyces sp. Act143]